MTNFADAVIARTKELGCPVAAGLDPRPGLLSDALQSEAGTTRGLAKAYEAFADGVLTGLADLVPVVKIQVAFYEALGLPGMKAYAYSVRRAKELGLLVIGDIKRGDIGTTAEAYAAGHVGSPDGFDLGLGAESDPPDLPLHVDCVTLSPYLGRDSMAPFLDVAREQGKGAFALVRTSNPSAREIQDLVVDGRPVFSWVADLVSSWGKDLIGSSGYSSLGAVVGATYPEELAAIRKDHPELLLLIPGYGAQGGGPADVISALDADGAGALIASSRGILRGFRDAAQKGLDPEQGIREEAIAMRDALRAAHKAVVRP